MIWLCLACSKKAAVEPAEPAVEPSADHPVEEPAVELSQGERNQEPAPALSNAPKPAASPTQVELGPGESAQGITVVSIKDSRCPKGVSCVWAGDAVVTVKVGADEGVLHTNPGSGSDLLELGGRLLRLQDVVPYPTPKEKPPQKAQIVLPQP